MPYTPSGVGAGAWAPDPQSVDEALDRLAAAVVARTVGGPIT
jgi:hypothetical protein